MYPGHREAERDVAGAVEAVCVAAKGEARAAAHGPSDEVGMGYAALRVQLDRDVVSNAQVDSGVEPGTGFGVGFWVETRIRGCFDIPAGAREFGGKGKVTEDRDRHATERVIEGGEPCVEVGRAIEVEDVWDVSREETVPPIQVAVGLHAPLRDVNLVKTCDDVIEVRKSACIERDARRLRRVSDADLRARRQAKIAYRPHVRTKLVESAEARVVHEDVFARADASP